MKMYICSVITLLLPTVTYSGKIYRNSYTDYQNDYPSLDDYDEAHYNDMNDKEPEEESHVERSDSTPVFVTSSKTFVVNEGDAIKLPCNVDNLESLLIIWKRGNRIITLGNKPYEDDDSRVQVEDTANGNTLVIRLSEEKDAGEYVCQVSAAKPIELKHMVKIVVRPEVHSIPQFGLIKVKSGEPAELGCQVTRGSPEPDVVWRRKERPMPSGEKTLSGLSITFPKTSRHHSGIYTCYADNGWRSPATATIRLDILHPPEIEQEMMTVRNKEESDIKITCTVHASPLPTVKWYKNGDLMMVKDNIISKRGNRHTLLLTEKQDRKGSYECKATNSLGEASAVLEVNSDEGNFFPKLKEIERTQDIGKKVPVFDSTEDVKVVENVNTVDPVDNVKVIENLNSVDLVDNVKVIKNVNTIDPVDEIPNAEADIESNDKENSPLAPHVEKPLSESHNSDNDEHYVTTSESRKPSKSEKLMDTSDSSKLSPYFCLLNLLSMFYIFWL